MKTVKDFLNEEWEENSGHILKKAILDKTCDLVGSYMTYADIEGSYLAVYSFWDHNIEDLSTVENKKWVGYEVRLDSEKTQWLIKNTGKDVIQLIVPQWVMNMEVKTEFHAKNLFKKYLKRI